MNLKETTEFVDGLLAIVDLGKKAGADGKIDLMDLPLLLGIIPVIGPAVDGVKLIPGELGHMSAEDASALVAHVMAKLTINDAKAVAIINEALQTGIHLAALVKAIKS